MLIEPPSALRPKSAVGPRMTSMRSMSSSGIRSKFTSSAVGSFTRTPSTKTLMPCGTPVTEVTWKPRRDTSVWTELPCSSLRVTPGRRVRASCSVGAPERRRASPEITCTLPGT